MIHVHHRPDSELPVEDRVPVTVLKNGHFLRINTAVMMMIKIAIIFYDIWKFINMVTAFEDVFCD